VIELWRARPSGPAAYAAASADYTPITKSKSAQIRYTLNDNRLSEIDTM
jgi:hypothetical protein